MKREIYVRNILENMITILKNENNLKLNCLIIKLLKRVVFKQFSCWLWFSSIFCSGHIATNAGVTAKPLRLVGGWQPRIVL
jgi:hypothetical protein